MNAMRAFLIPMLLLAPSKAHTQELAATTSTAQRLDSASVVAAIALGRSGKKPFGYSTGATGGGFVAALCGAAVREGVCAFGILAQGPVGRIVTAAALASKKYTAFTPDSVTAELAAPILLIIATPAPPTRVARTWSSAPAATHIVIQTIAAKNEEPVTIQPLRVETFPVSWSNAFGAAFEGQGVRAYFDGSGIPAEDFAIVVVNSGKEARYGVRKKDRDKLR